MKNLFTFITKLAIASAFVFVFSATYASAATYYMSPTGSDSNSGTISSPWFSLERAWQSIAAGDTVYLRGGTYAYSNSQYLQGKNGTSGNLIKIWAYPGETPNITRSSTYKIVNGVDQDLIYFEGNYFHFKGLEISNFAQKSNETPYPAFRAGYTNHSTFENINYHHNMSAFQIRGNSTGNLILNSDFHHNKDPYGDAPYDGADGLGITFNYDTNSVNTIRGSRAYWNADDGFDTWENSGHVIIENSWAFYNGYLPDTFTEAGNGTAFKLGSISNSSTQTKRTLKNNLAYKNRFAGFVENNAGVKMEMYNNTSVNAGYSGYWVGAWSGNGNVTIAKNNLDYLGTNAPGPWNSASTVTNNSWQNNITVTNADFASMDDSQLLRARKSDNSLPDITFLTPVASSDLVNKGTPISGMSYVGSAPDIGAFEYGGTTTTTSTTFTVGQRVQVNATSLNVRGTASATGTLLGTQTSGALGTVTAGPTSADGYVWWNVNYDSGVDGWSAENYLTSYTAPTPDTTAPTVPTNLAGTATSSSQINLSWTASTDAVGVTGYKIYRNGTQIATSTTNSYNNTGLTAGTTYSYTVAAYDAAGNTSSQSTAKSVATSAATPVSTTFTVGQRVQVNATSLNVRGTASATGTLLGTQTSGALGTVTAGPTSADGYVWWNVNYDSGVDGWSAENYITAYTATTTTTGAKTYYLSPTGNDNNACTLASPCFTLQKAWTLIAPGDTVYLRGGTYTYTKQQGLIDKNGTASNIIKIWAYPGETPVITRSATGYTTDIYWHRAGIFFTGNYFHFKGLEITGYKNISGNIENGFLGYDASNNKFEQLNIHHNHHGFYLENNSSNNLVLNSDFHDNYDTQGSGGNSDGVGLSYNTGANNVVDGCRAWNNGDDGFDTFEHKGLVTIKNSWAWHNGYVLGTSTPAGNGVGFKLGSNFLQGTSLQNTVVRVVQNTISADNRDSGYHINEGDHRTQLYNNVSYANGVMGLNFHWNNLVHTFKNNVSFGNGNTQVEISSNSVSSNNSYGIGGSSDGGSGWAATASTADFTSLDLNQLDNPRKADGSLPDITAFHLASTSDLINAGTPISGISYTGSAPDIGAFEYGGTVTTTDTVAPTASITTPTSSSTVAGTASTVSATAIDNVAVSKVEFYRGTALVSSDTATPYSATWDTTTVANGSYTLSAKAYDTSGNVGTSSSVAVVVSNTTVDTTAPTVPTNLAGTATSSSQINLSWTASTDAVGVTGYKIYRNGTQIATSTTNSYNNTGLTAGTTYSYTVAAYDAAGNTSSQSTAKSVATKAVVNVAPVANAGSDQTITLPTSSVTLSGSGTDSDGTISSYAWTKVSGGSATISSPTTKSTKVTGLSQGTYTFWLTVTDNSGGTNADSVTIVVNPAPVANVSPVANAGSDKTITLPTSSVTLSGSGTDSDGTIASYLWTKISGTGGTINSSTSASTTFSGLTQGSYTLRLTVADNLGATAYDDVTVTVNPEAGTGGGNGFSDDFNRADSTTFGSSWIKRVSGTADFKLISNKIELIGNYLETASLHTTSGISSPNYTVQSKITFPSTENMFAGVAGRRINKTGANYNGYMAFAEPGEQSVTLYKRVGTTWTRLGTYATTINPGTEYTIGLSMNGTTIKALWNGAEVLSVTDSKFTATGSAAIVIGTGYEVVGVTWDDFSVTPN